MRTCVRTHHVRAHVGAWERERVQCKSSHPEPEPSMEGSLGSRCCLRIGPWQQLWYVISTMVSQPRAGGECGVVHQSSNSGIGGGMPLSSFMMPAILSRWPRCAESTWGTVVLGSACVRCERCLTAWGAWGAWGESSAQLSSVELRSEKSQIHYRGPRTSAYLPR